MAAIANEPASTWDLGSHSFIDEYEEVLQLRDRIRDSFSVNASDTLVTKTMLGVFGCIPAFDRYFRVGFGCSTVCRRALTMIGSFYEANRTKFDTTVVYTIDFSTGHHTRRTYPPSKLIDMVFFQVGFNIEAQEK